MKKTIIKRFILPIILLLLYFLFLFLITKNSNNLKKSYVEAEEQIADIYMLSDNVSVIHIIDFKNSISDIKKDGEYIDLYFINPLKIRLPYYDNFKINLNVDYTSEFVDSKTIKISIPSEQFQLLIEELEKNDYKLKYSYERKIGYTVEYLDPKTNKISFEINSNSKISEINIHLQDDEYNILNHQIGLKKVNKDTYCLKHLNTDYVVKLVKVHKIFDMINISFNEEKYKYEKILLALGYVFGIIIVIILGILTIIRLKNRIVISRDEYERNTENVIDPILAESVIDGKINANNLITTCIVNMIYKKCLEISDNNVLKVISIYNLSDIEKYVLQLLFIGTTENTFVEKLVGKTIIISDLNKKIKNNKYMAGLINTNYLEIKDRIKAKLIQLNIIDSLWDFILKALSKILKVMFYCIIIIPSLIITEFAGYTIIFILLAIAFDMVLNKKNIIVIYLLLFLGLFLSVVFENTFYLGMLLNYAVLLILNILISKLTNTYVYTSKGKEEYKKAYMLKKYLIDYSLISQRDIDGVIVYDEYLVFATAFGITSNITKKINENLIELNIKLQRLEEFIYY